MWWHDSLVPPLAGHALQSDIEIDVAVVGGGYTGLSAALHLAEAGVRVAVFEARHIGFGASGRNGGQIIPGLKYDPDDLVAKYGPEHGRQLVQLAGGAADFTFDLIERLNIRCRPVRAGWIQAAHSPLALEPVVKRARQWQAEGVAVEILDRDEVAARTGTAAHFGGWRDPRAGSVQPLDFLRGLAHAAADAGAQICEQSEVQSLKPASDGPNARWQLGVGKHRVRARTVLIGTNGYPAKGLVPGLAQSVLPVQSMQLATAPLDATLSEKIMPGGVMLSQTRKLAFYMRRTPAGGFMIGGRGAVGNTEAPGLMTALERGMLQLFPDLRGTQILHRWSGHVCLSLDGLPHLHETSPGLYALQAYNGRGIALATRFGKMLADEIVSRSPAIYPKTKVKPIVWHSLRRPVMGLGVRWYWMKDRLGLASK
nr:FAD-dependent oxidoreductase [Pseudogemmobacter hezensis]